MLPVFSLDLVGLIASYLVFGVATPNSKPKLLSYFGKYVDQVIGPGQFKWAVYSIAVCPYTSNVWVGHFDGVQIFDEHHDFIRRVAQDELSWRCAGIAFDSNREVYIVNNGKGYVLVCDIEGNVLRRIGQEKKFNSPWSVAVDGKGLVYVVDQDTRVKVFNRDGSFVRAIGEPGSADGQLKSPTGIALLPKDEGHEVFVVDQYNHRIQARFVSFVLFLVFSSHCCSVCLGV